MYVYSYPIAICCLLTKCILNKDVSVWELPYMMSASEGGGGNGKADVVGEVTLIL